MGRFFKIAFPNDKSFVVVSPRGYAGLTEIVGAVPDKDGTYIIELSTWEFIKYCLGGK